MHDYVIITLLFCLPFTVRVFKFCKMFGWQSCLSTNIVSPVDIPIKSEDFYQIFSDLSFASDFVRFFIKRVSN